MAKIIYPKKKKNTVLWNISVRPSSTWNETVNECNPCTVNTKESVIYPEGEKMGIGWKEKGKQE